MSYLEWPMSGIGIENRIAPEEQVMLNALFRDVCVAKNISVNSVAARMVAERIVTVYMWGVRDTDHLRELAERFSPRTSCSH